MPIRLSRANILRLESSPLLLEEIATADVIAFYDGRSAMPSPLWRRPVAEGQAPREAGTFKLVTFRIEPEDVALLEATITQLKESRGAEGYARQPPRA